MNEAAISIRNLSKRYTLGTRATLGESLRERLMRALRAPFANRRGVQNEIGTESAGQLLALDDVSFDVQPGEIVGIVGRNGAGKSTLLKILSRITLPSAGDVTLRGRVASLLEVGTGFHPELTGRENIYLNGAILGMSRAEIGRKFDEIVAFAEIEKFLDTPVKRYSSGMYVRLAFAVSAHLEQDILIVDEVLAVGDAAFQDKCLSKMNDVADRGRTILFVSHNMGAITRLCHRCVWLASGQVKADGKPRDVVASYLMHGAEESGVRHWPAPDADATTTSGVHLRAVRIGQGDQDVVTHIDIDAPFHVDIEVDVCIADRELGISIKIDRYDGECLLHTAHVADDLNTKADGQRWRLRCDIPAHLLNVGRYFLTIAADVPFKEILVHEEHALTFSVRSLSTRMGRYDFDSWQGAVGPFIADWSLAADALPENDIE